MFGDVKPNYMVSRCLIVDTATEKSIAGLAVDGTIVAFKEIADGLTNSRFLLSAVDDLLSELSLCVEDLTFCVLGVGPGSYTGIRVAAAFAKGLCFPTGIPLVGVTTLKGFVPYENQEGTFIAAIDARIGGIYTLRGVKNKDQVRFTSEPALVSVAEFEKSLQSCDYLVTPSKEPLLARIEESPLRIIERGPSVKQLAIEGQKAFIEGSFSSDILYLRKTQAEIEREAKELPNL